MGTVYNYLADAVVVIHATYIAFVIFGLLAILAGFLFHWEWVRNFWFRLIHFLMILVVVLQALVGVKCPLTILEMHWREKGGETVYTGSFIGHWAHELIFFRAPAWVFTVCYCVFGAMVLGTFFLVPPHPPKRRLSREEEGMSPGGLPDAN